MYCVRFFIGVLFAAVVSGSAIAPVGAGPLGDFNVLTFGDYSSTSNSVDGRLYAGGNVSINSYSIGAQLSGSLVGGDSLVVGGDLTFPQGSVNNGNVVVGGSAAGVQSPVTNGLANAGLTLTSGVGYANVPVDFAAQETHFAGLSNAFAGLSATGTAVQQWGGVYLTGDGTSSQQVFNFDGSLFNGSTYVNLSGVTNGMEIVFNISGSSVSMSGGLPQFLTDNRENVIYNFFEADSLTLTNIGIQGSVIAPDATIYGNGGDIWGQVVSDGWDGSTAVHGVYYGGSLPAGFNGGGQTAEVAAPGMTGLLLLCVAYLLRLRRREAYRLQIIGGSAAAAAHS